MDIMEKITNKIKENRIQYLKLKTQLENLQKDKFSYLIGKCFETSATSMIKVKDIDYIDEIYIHVECIRVFGGVHSNGCINVDLDEQHAFKLVDKHEQQEVSEKKFNNFVTESLDQTKKYLFK